MDDFFRKIWSVWCLIDNDGPENEEHLSHTGTADSHFLFAFFEETLVEVLKNGSIFQSIRRFQGIVDLFEMVLLRFSPAGCRIQSFYHSTCPAILQILPFPPTSSTAHSRKGKVADVTQKYNIQRPIK